MKGLKRSLSTIISRTTLGSSALWKEKQRKTSRICRRSPAFPVTTTQSSTNSRTPPSTVMPCQPIQESTQTSKLVVRCVELFAWIDNYFVIQHYWKYYKIKTRSMLAAAVRFLLHSRYRTSHMLYNGILCETYVTLFDSCFLCFSRCACRDTTSATTVAKVLKDPNSSALTELSSGNSSNL